MSTNATHRDDAHEKLKAAESAAASASARVLLAVDKLAEAQAVHRDALAEVNAIRRVVGQTVAQVDTVANLTLAALVRAGAVDARALRFPVALIRRLDPVEAQQQADIAAAERIAREDSERAYAERPDVVEHRRAVEIKALRHRLADWSSEPTHPRAVEARRRLAELEAEAAKAA